MRSGFIKTPRDLQEQFQQSGDESRNHCPLLFWEWNDRLDPTEVRRQIRSMAAAGLGGFVVAPAEGLESPYGGSEWLDALEAAIDEARRTGIGIWLHDGGPDFLTRALDTPSARTRPPVPPLEVVRLRIQSIPDTGPPPPGDTTVARFLARMVDGRPTDLEPFIESPAEPAASPEPPPAEDNPPIERQSSTTPISDPAGADPLTAEEPLAAEAPPSIEAPTELAVANPGEIDEREPDRPPSDSPEPGEEPEAIDTADEPQPGGWPGSDGRILLHFYREVIGPLDWLNPQAVQALIDRSLDLHYREFGSEYGRTVRGLMLAAAQRPSPDIVPPDLSKQPASLIPHPATESAIPYSPILDAHLRHAHDRKLSEYLPAIFFETNSDDIRDYFEAIETLYAEAFVLIQRWCARRDIALATGLVEPDPSDPVHAPSLPPLAAAYWLGAKALATPQWRDGKTPIGDAAPLVLHRSAYSLKGARSQTGAHALHTPWWSYTAPLHQALGRISMLIAEDASRALIFNPPTGVDASLPPDAADERSMNSMSQRGSSNYLLEDSTNGNIRVRHRDAGRYQFLVLVNGSEASPAIASVSLTGEGRLEAWDPLTGTITPVESTTDGAAVRGRVEIPAAGAVVLGLDTARTAWEGHPVETSIEETISLPQEWQLTLLDRNLLALESCRYKMEKSEWMPAAAIGRIESFWAEQGGSLLLRYSVDVAPGVPHKDLELVLEALPGWTVALNGMSLHGRPKDFWLDPAFRRYPVSLAPGRNILLLTADPAALLPDASRLNRSQTVASNESRGDHDLPQTDDAGLAHHYGGGSIPRLYLLGRFSAGGSTAPGSSDTYPIAPLPDRVQPAHLSAAGFAAFQGTLRLQASFRLPKLRGRRVFLEMDEPGAAAVVVRVNGKSAGAVMWPPYCLDITDRARSGRNAIALEVVSASTVFPPAGATASPASPLTGNGGANSEGGPSEGRSLGLRNVHITVRRCDIVSSG